MKLFDLILFVLFCAAAFLFFKFGPMPEFAYVNARGLNQQPAMIPGVEAVRPPAASQHAVSHEIMSELVNPSPAHMPLHQPRMKKSISPQFSGIVKNLDGDNSVNSFTVYSNGKKKLIRTEIFDPESGVLKSKTLERFHEEILKRQIDEIYDTHGNMVKKFSTLFDGNGNILKKEVDLNLDGHPDEAVEF